jgi:hypothetical protein
MSNTTASRRLTRGAACLLGVVLAAGTVAACSSEKSVVSDKADSVSLPDISIPDVSLPDVSLPDISIPDISIPDISIPDVSIPDINSPAEALDFVITQMELAGVQVDRDCVEKFLEDESIRDQINNSGGQLPPQLLQSFFACIKT